MKHFKIGDLVTVDFIPDEIGEITADRLAGVRGFYLVRFTKPVVPNEYAYGTPYESYFIHDSIRLAEVVGGRICL